MVAGPYSSLLDALHSIRYKFWIVVGTLRTSTNSIRNCFVSICAGEDLVCLGLGHTRDPSACGSGTLVAFPPFLNAEDTQPWSVREQGSHGALQITWGVNRNGKSEGLLWFLGAGPPVG